MSRLLPVAFKIFIAQPGLRKQESFSGAAWPPERHPELLVGDLQIPFGVIASLDVRTGLDERKARQAHNYLDTIIYNRYEAKEVAHAPWHTGPDNWRIGIDGDLIP